MLSSAAHTPAPHRQLNLGGESECSDSDSDMEPYADVAVTLDLSNVSDDECGMRRGCRRGSESGAKGVGSDAVPRSPAPLARRSPSPVGGEAQEPASPWHLRVRCAPTPGSGSDGSMGSGVSPRWDVDGGTPGGGGDTLEVDEDGDGVMTGVGHARRRHPLRPHTVRRFPDLTLFADASAALGAAHTGTRHGSSALRPPPVPSQSPRWGSASPPSSPTASPMRAKRSLRRTPASPGASEPDTRSPARPRVPVAPGTFLSGFKRRLSSGSPSPRMVLSPFSPHRPSNLLAAAAAAANASGSSHSDLFSSPDVDSPYQVTTPRSVNRDAFADMSAVSTPNTARKKARHSMTPITGRPRPDQDAFDVSEALQRSTPKRDTPVCPPTPVRTPVWKVPSLERSNSLIVNRTLLQDSDDDTDCDSADDSDRDGSGRMLGVGGNAPATPGAEGSPAGDGEVPHSGGDRRRGNHHHHHHHHHHRHRDATPVVFERDFVNLGVIGQGSFCKVYKARSNSDGLEYAVKRTLRPYRSKRDRDMYLNEFKMVRRIEDCPNIIHYKRAWQEQGHLYQQIELCPRGSLMDLLAQLPDDTACPAEAVYTVIADAASALVSIHKAGLVHLDLKPENLFISSTGMVKIGDFGLARDCNPSAAHHPGDDDGAEGDSRYMAKELLNAGGVAAPADIFSLGMTAMEMAWDLAPPTDGTGWHSIRDGTMPDLPERCVRAGRPLELLNLIRSMMHPDPAQRPTAEQLFAIPAVRAAHGAAHKVLASASSEAVTDPASRRALYATPLEGRSFGRSSSYCNAEELGIAALLTEQGRTDTVMIRRDTTAAPPCQPSPPRAAPSARRSLLGRSPTVGAELPAPRPTLARSATISQPGIALARSRSGSASAVPSLGPTARPPMSRSASVMPADPARRPAGPLTLPSPATFSGFANAAGVFTPTDQPVRFQWFR